MPDVRFEKRGHIAILTLDRAERLNAVGSQMRADLAAAVATIEAHPDLRVGILTAEGRAFSAGADLKEMRDPDAPRIEAPSGFPFLQSSRPFIAAINGFAIGAGFDMALDCDIRICATTASFSLPEPRIGLLAGYSLDRLPRIIGLSAASQLLLTAERIDAPQALAWGLVTEVVEPDRLLPRAVEIAEQIAANAPLAVQATKAVIRAWRETLVPDSERLHEWVNRAVRASEDAQEGPRAFAEKRPPVWQGR